MLYWESFTQPKPISSTSFIFGIYTCMLNKINFIHCPLYLKSKLYMDLLSDWYVLCYLHLEAYLGYAKSVLYNIKWKTSSPFHKLKQQETITALDIGLRPDVWCAKAARCFTLAMGEGEMRYEEKQVPGTDLMGTNSIAKEHKLLGWTLKHLTTFQMWKIRNRGWDVLWWCK